MNKLSRLIFTGALIASTSCLGFGGLASAAVPTLPTNAAQVYRASLNPLNNSGASGTATVIVKGDQVRVSIHSTGLSPNLPHAEHIHIGGQNVCPTIADDTNGDGIVDIAEGMPKYGDVKVSLVTSGDDSAGSALALDRYPVADANGTINYHEILALPSGVSASDIASGVIVQHGISELSGDPTKYDGSTPSSDADAPAGTPLEATVPADCGKLMPLSRGNTGANGNAINNSGPGSHNSIRSSSRTTSHTTNTNHLNVSNESSQRAQTGNASSAHNARGGTVSSGSASNSSSLSEMFSIKNN